MITYNNYPLLLHTSFNVEDAPEHLPFEVSSEAVREYLSRCVGYQELFTFIAAKNTIFAKNTNTHYHLNDDIFKRIDSDDFFRNEMFQRFFSEYIKPKNGVITFKQNGQYLYNLLGVQETKKLKGKKGRYIAVALFRGDFFVGFEEGYITERGIQVEQTGHYSIGMPPGGYISFILVTLAFAGEKDHKLIENNKTNEIIYKL